MIQIILLAGGILILLREKLKVSSSRVLYRPQSTYLGIFLVLFGLGMGLVPEDLIYQIVLYISLVIVAGFIVSKGQKIPTDEMTTKPSETIRNTIIFLIFIICLIGALYFFAK